MELNLWVVTRQHYYYGGNKVVEIAQGGRDYSGSDALGSKYKGEFEEFTDIREAVETAIQILKAWRADAKTRNIHLSLGCNQGMGMELDEIGIRAARKAAKAIYAEAPKCDVCSGLMGKERYQTDLTDDDMDICSEYCAEKIIEQYYRDNPDTVEEEVC